MYPEPRRIHFSAPARLLVWTPAGTPANVQAPVDAVVAVAEGMSLHRSMLVGCDVLLIVADDLSPRKLRQAIRAVLTVSGCPPAVLVTSFFPQNVRLLPGIPIAAVESIDANSELILHCALRLATGSERRRFADMLVTQIVPRPTPTKAVASAFLDHEPITRVEDLADACYVTSRTLHRQWKTSWLGRPMSVKTLIDWSLLLRSREMLRLAMGQVEIAFRLGLDERTVRRLPQRLLSRKWGCLVRTPYQEVVNAALGKDVAS